MSDDPFDTDESRVWVRHVLDELVPMIADSAVTISLVPNGPTDVKFAVELGLSIMLDKPIIAVVQPGTAVPAHLLRVADELVEVDLSGPHVQRRIGDAIARVMLAQDERERRAHKRNPPAAPGDR
jgi:hypothetical protein